MSLKKQVLDKGLAIIEEENTISILDKVFPREWMTVEVITTFCKSAIAAHQLVNNLPCKCKRI